MSSTKQDHISMEKLCNIPIEYEEVDEVEKPKKIPNPNEVQLIFKETYALYRKFHEFELFKVIINALPTTDFETATEIMSEVYVLFKKHERTWKDEEWIDLINEARELGKKYPCPLATNTIVEILDVIEKYYKYKTYED